MSSPIALKKKSLAHKALISMHQLVSHKRRVGILSEILSDLIVSEFRDTKTIRCLDVGCGDMQIVENIGIRNKYVLWSCIDIYELPADANMKKWGKYRKFDGANIPYDDKSMDVVLFCDVLHHSPKDAPALLREAARVGKTVIIKDHFEYSHYSRLMLRLMDIIGNWGYGVRIPERYFTVQRFNDICLFAGLKVKRISAGLELYPNFLRYLLKPEWQFTAILEPINEC